MSTRPLSIFESIRTALAARGGLRRRGRFFAGMTAALAAVVLVLAVGTSAQAAQTVQVFNTGGSGVASRTAPSLAATNGYGAPEGATVTTICWTWGDAVGPNSNRLWWLISYAGRQFYAADRYLTTPNIANQPPAGEPHCGAGSSTSPSGYKPAVWVGSPVDGTWDLPASQGGDGPTKHHWLANANDQGDFAVDLIANAGQPVTLYAAPVNTQVSITARVDQVGASCSGGANGGSFATIGFYYNGTRVGSATYAHLQLAVTQGQTLDRWGSRIGYVGSDYPRNAACWTGPHVHFQLYATAPNYACFNKGYSLGQAVRPTNFLGSTAGTTNTSYRQPCP